MGWFQEQIRSRIIFDEEMLKEAFADLSASIMGRQASYAMLYGKEQFVRGAVGEILKYYHCSIPDVETGESEDIAEQLEQMLRPVHILKRTVRLTGAWYRDSDGPLLARIGGQTVALIPGRLWGYHYRDPESNRVIKVDRNKAKIFEEEAFCFYRPLPQRALTSKDLLRYMVTSLSLSDYVTFALAALFVTLIGMITPVVNNLIFSRVITSGDTRFLLSSILLLLSAYIALFLITIFKQLLLARINTKLKVALQAAFMGRLLALPTGFFKLYSAGQIAEQTNMVGSFCEMVINAVLSIGLMAVFSLLYVFQIIAYAPALALPAMLTILVILIFSVYTIMAQSRLTSAKLGFTAKANGLIFQLFKGIQKIRLVGAENRAFSQWAYQYSDIAKLDFDPPFIIKGSAAITNLIRLMGTVAIYLLAARSQISIADFMSFNVAYGMVSGSVLSLSTAAAALATIGPIIHMLQPILKAAPEVTEAAVRVNRLSGSFELNNVSFRYSESMPMVVDNLSLKVQKGQYIAIVGKTGCGKSTLIRLLLGFEKPQLGAVYYDGKDLGDLDAGTVRRNIGVVMQNGKLLNGSLYGNIVIAAPWLTMDDAWEAAEMAGLADDIRAMPMGMFTMVSEGGGGFSGGQKQRLMIARAIAAKPRILFLDEATSALDNITQKHVSDALAGLKSTRIVIAHRLSTIKECDRIIVLDGGGIAEDGTYDELVSRKGIFAELVARQQL
jgi:NHLM bacteriocin system ABC transporter ATP-binding protein